MHLARDPLGYSAERAALGGRGGADSAYSLTHEPAAVARRMTRQSKPLKEYFLGKLGSFVKKVTSEVNARPKVKIVTFALSVTKMD